MRRFMTTSDDGLVNTYWYGFSDSNMDEACQHVKTVEYWLTEPQLFNNDIEYGQVIDECYRIAVNAFLDLDSGN